MVKWDPGPKKLEKGSPNTQTKLSCFPQKLCFFWVFFLLILCSVLGRLFCDFDGQSARNDAPLGTLFQTFCCKAGKLKCMVSSTPNTTFHGFWGSGLGMLGIFFQVVFWTGSGDVFFWFFVRFRLQLGTQMVTLGHHFRYKLKVDFLMNFRGVRGHYYLQKLLTGEALWSYLAKAK